MKAIQMKLNPAVAPVAPGSSYFWDAPQLPRGQDLYPCFINEDGDEVPMQFICQVNCKEMHDALAKGKGLAARIEACTELPHHGMLYFFGNIDYYLGYDVPCDCGLGWWAEGSVKAVYVEDPGELERVNPYTEDDMILPHPITFSASERADCGMRLLGTPFEQDVEQEVPEGWRLLLQLDSDENEHFSLMFCDMGLLYIFIEEERLKNRDFSNLRAYMTSQ